MKLSAKFLNLCHRLRQRFFKLAAKAFLGDRTSAMLFGHGVIHYLASDIQFPDVESCLQAKYRLAEAHIMQYSYPKNAPAYFPTSTAFDEKTAYVFSGATILPKSGAVFLKSLYFLEESMVATDIYMVYALAESFNSSHDLNLAYPVFPFATCFVYYHELLEVMLAALQARDICPKCKILIHRNHAKYIDEMLSFFNIPKTDIIEVATPVRVKSCLFVPHIHNRSFVSQFDASFMSNKVQKHLPHSGISHHGKKIYVSRRKTPGRRIENEEELELRLAKLGFTILFFEEMSFIDQMISINQAEILVAPHGSGLANLVAAKIGTKVVEIISPEWRRSTFARLSSELKLDYRCCEAIECEGCYYAPIEIILGLISAEGRLK